MTDLKDKINKLSFQAQTTPLIATCDTRLLFEVLNEVEEILEVFEIIKEHLSFKDSGIEEYFDFKTNQKVKKYIFEIESKDTGATIHIHLDTKEEFNSIKEMFKDE